MWLKARGYGVHELAGGWTVRQTLHYDVFDGMILNLHLPDLDGFAVVKQVREDRLGLPILVMSGEYSDTQKANFETLGVQGFLPKPFDWDKLIAWLSQWVNPPKSNSKH